MGNAEYMGRNHSAITITAAPPGWFTAAFPLTHRREIP